MGFYDVQVTTDLGETVVLNVAADTPMEAEYTAMSMVECGQAGTMGTSVVECFTV